MSIFRGSGVAIVTPFQKGAVDFTAFTRLIELQIANRTDAIICVGTTGESSTLTDDERLSVIQFVVERVNGRVPVIAGTGGNNTEEVISNSKSAEAIGVDGLLIVTPYYNKTSQQGLVRHFFTIADALETPIIVYNVPSRTGLNVLPQTMAELCTHENIVGTKEASGNIGADRQHRGAFPAVRYLWQATTTHVLPVAQHRRQGSHLHHREHRPRRNARAVRSVFSRAIFSSSRQLQLQMIPLWKAAFCEVNPIPLKAMMGLMQLCEPDVRLPLVPPSPASMRLIEETLKGYELI